MTDYTKTTDFAIKDNLPAGDSGKIIRGGEFDVEFNNLQSVSLTKADLISPIFVGTVTAPVLSVTGTATAAFFVGDGSGLTNITGASQDLQGVTDQGSSTTNGIITGGLISTGSVGITGDLTIGSATSVSINNYALPIADGTVGQVLTTDGAGVSSWTTPSAGSASTLQQVTTAGATTTDRISVGGLLSAQSSASINAFSAGLSAGDTNQGAAAVAVGYLAGETNQTSNSVAIGNLAGNSTQGGNSVALGLQAGSSNQGAQSVAIGWLAGVTNQGSNGIILNSSGLSLNEGSTGHIRIASNQGELRFTSSGGWEMIDGGTTYLNVPATGGLSVTGTTTSTAFVGDGSGLTNLPAGSTSNLQAVTDIGATTTNAITTAGLTSNGVVDVTGNIIVSGTVDGRDVNADGVKLDAIEPLADVTDAVNVTAAGALMTSGGAMTGAITTSSTFDGRNVSADGAKLDTIDSNADVTSTVLNTSTATASQVLSWTGSDYDWITAASGGGTNLTNTVTNTDFTINSSSGTNTSLPAATTTTWGVMTDEDKDKLTNIEPLADVTDTTNVTAALSSGTGIDISVSGQISNTAPDQTVALTQGGATTVSGTYPNFTISSTDTTYTDADVDTHLNTSTATSSQVLSWTGSDYDWISVAVGAGTNLTNTATTSGLTINSSTGTNTDLPAATASTWGVMTDEDKAKLNGIQVGAQVNVGTSLVAFQTALSTTITSSTGGDAGISGATITASGVMTSTDKVKLEGIEALADVTDVTNVTAAGALMDSELTSIASVKALNQGVATSNSPEFADLTLSGDPVYRNVTANIASANVTFSTSTPTGGANGDIWYEYQGVA